jgi:PAS domain S-box-containing protein
MEIELSRLIDALPGLVWTALPDGRVELINRRWCEYTGLALHQTIDFGWYCAVHVEDLPRALEHWRSCFDSGRSCEMVVRLRRHDGEYRRFLWSAAPIADPSGQIVRGCGVNIDIEERLNAEDGLRTRESYFRSIFDGLPALVLVMTPRGDLELANRHALEFFGASLEELRGWVRGALFHTEDYPLMLACWQRSQDTGEPFELEARQRRADGVYRWMRVSGFPLRNEQHQIAHWCCRQIDIDDAKRAEAELRQAYRCLAEAQRLSQTGSYTADLVAGEYVWSDELYRIFELAPGSKISLQLVRELIHPDDAAWAQANFMRAATQGTDLDQTFRIVTRSGKVKHVHSVAHVVRYVEGQPVFTGAIQDVTERKVTEVALDKARAELSYMARVMTLSALTASVAHEISQSLSGIITNTSTCLRMLAADPPNIDGARTTAQRTMRDGNRASEVIQRLRALFTRKQPKTEPFNLNDAAREVLALSSSELQQNRVVLRTDLAQGLPTVSGDRVQLQQVILNLILNAADAMREVTDRPRNLLVSTALEGAKRVRLSVRDSGVGIDPQSAERLFEAFYTTKTTGMGIGLSISRSIIESHEGRLWASANEDGPGSTFSFSIPIGSTSDTASTRSAPVPIYLTPSQAEEHSSK